MFLRYLPLPNREGMRIDLSAELIGDVVVLGLVLVLDCFLPSVLSHILRPLQGLWA